MFINRILIAGFAVAVVALAPAHAADLPAAQPYRAPAMVAPAFSWTGFYAGANVGYGSGKLNDLAGTTSDSLAGAIAGGQIGGNYQTGSLVFGVEGDMQGSWQSKSVSGNIPGLGLVTIKGEIPWFATFRGRVGAAFDRHLLYLTAGGAYTDFKLSGTRANVTTSADTSHVAWTAGGGWEWMFMDRWSTKVEYLYIDTGNVGTTIAGVPVTGRLKDNVLRAGINYHF